MKTVAIVGFGSRGQMFGKLAAKIENVKLVAVAEPLEVNRDRAIELGLTQENIFLNADEFFAQGKICDAVFICTQDKDHCRQALEALELGYDICLEKPAATTVEDCILIRDTAKRLGRKVMLTHVLRYTPFYGYIKKLIVSGKLGEIVHIDQTENIAYWHFSLSFVRGPWRDMTESTPTVIAKCCHDLDIIKWLMDKKCTDVSSYGSLHYYNEAHAPEGSAAHCADCRKDVREKCVYNAYTVYPERISRGVVGGTARLRGQSVEDILNERKDPISKCVFRSDNDAVDTQVVNMRFADGATAHLTMTAFSRECHRRVHVYGTHGEVFGDMDDHTLTVNIFGESTQTVDINKLVEDEKVNLKGGHGGGDYFLFKDFLDYITEDSENFTRTTIEDSIESHVIGFKAEESRRSDGRSIKIS